MTASTIPEVDVTDIDSATEHDTARERLVHAHVGMKQAEQLADDWRRVRALIARELRFAGTTLREIGEILDVKQTQVGRILADAERFAAETTTRPRLSATAKELLVAVRDRELQPNEAWTQYLPDVPDDQLQRALDRLLDVGYVTQVPWEWGQPWPGRLLDLTDAGRARTADVKPE